MGYIWAMSSAPDDGPRVPFEDLRTADLTVDMIYSGGSRGTSGDEPICRLVPGVGNMGGFRISGSPAKGTVRLTALYTTGMEVDWPDYLDTETGVFTYYGDNRTPGKDLHVTNLGGNRLLRTVFDAARGSINERQKVPPFLLFEKAGTGRDVRFRGLLAPGGENMTSDDELAAIWRSTRGHRFQNYRARFTVLDESHISRAWLEHLHCGGSPLDGECPEAWRRWVTDGVYKPLRAPATVNVRSKAEQLPTEPGEIAILEAIRKHFRERPTDFESCAVAIWRLIAPATGRCDVTRPSRDGGRDAVGEYIIGPPTGRIPIDFALEAKCYQETHGVGTKEMSRLSSRLRYRHFGVFVTTSYFYVQTQKEIREDSHPIVMISGKDIVNTFRQHGYTTAQAVSTWLDQNFPR